MGCQQSVEVPGRGMDDPLRCPLGTEELKKQTTTATKKKADVEYVCQWRPGAETRVEACIH